MQEEHRNARWISLLDIGELDSIRKLNRRDDGRHVYCPTARPRCRLTVRCNR